MSVWALNKSPQMGAISRQSAAVSFSHQAGNYGRYSQCSHLAIDNLICMSAAVRLR